MAARRSWVAVFNVFGETSDGAINKLKDAHE